MNSKQASRFFIYMKAKKLGESALKSPTNSNRKAVWLKYWEQVVSEAFTATRNNFESDGYHEPSLSNELNEARYQDYEREHLSDNIIDIAQLAYGAIKDEGIKANFSSHQEFLSSLTPEERYMNYFLDREVPNEIIFKYKKYPKDKVVTSCITTGKINYSSELFKAAKNVELTDMYPCVEFANTNLNKPKDFVNFIKKSLIYTYGRSDIDPLTDLENGGVLTVGGDVFLHWYPEAEYATVNTLFGQSVTFESKDIKTCNPVSIGANPKYADLISNLKKFQKSLTETFFKNLFEGNDKQCYISKLSSSTLVSSFANKLQPSKKQMERIKKKYRICENKNCKSPLFEASNSKRKYCSDSCKNNKK